VSAFALSLISFRHLIMADNEMSASEKSKKALQEEKIQADILRRKIEEEKQDVDHKHTDDWALL
jgi:hypothetical protein